MKTKVTIVCENSVEVPFPLIAEHGLSMLIEGEDTTLFDTGQGLGLMNNLNVLGKNPEIIDRLILSHGHYDHTGGLMAFLQARNKETPIYVNPQAFVPKVALLPTAAEPAEMPIGFPEKKESYVQQGAVFHDVNGLYRFNKAMSFLTDVERPEGWKSWDERLMQKPASGLINDPFNDDGSILLNTDSGPVVLLGCAHAGVVEILDELAQKNNINEFYAVIGGSHLSSAPEDYVQKAIESLKKYRVQLIALSHCTGFAVSARLAGIFKDSYTNASVAKSFEF